jgi:hypothetical protein
MSESIYSIEEELKPGTYTKEEIAAKVGVELWRSFGVSFCIILHTYLN